MLLNYAVIPETVTCSSSSCRNEAFTYILANLITNSIHAWLTKDYRSSDMYATCMYIFLFLYSGRYILYYITISQVAHKQMIKAYSASQGLSTTAQLITFKHSYRLGQQYDTFIYIIFLFFCPMLSLSRYKHISI